MASSGSWARSASLRQTQFGSSPRNKLVLLDRHRPKRNPKEEVFIFRLPDELLDTILKLAALSLGFRGWCCDCKALGNYTVVKKLVLVCRRFHRVVLPLLYHTIRFDYPHQIVPPTTAVRRLYRGLQENPSLRQYCKAFSIHVSDIRSTSTVEDFFFANVFVSWLTKVRCLQIYGGFDKPHNEQTWLLIRNIVQQMREIEHLFIARECWGLHLGPIMEQIDLPSLRKLEIHGISERKDGPAILESKVLASIILRFTLLWKGTRRTRLSYSFQFQAIIYED